MTIKLLHFLPLRSLEEWSCGIVQLDGSPGRLLINAVHNVARYIPVSCVARKNHESAEAMVNETSHSLEINALHGICGERNRARKLHVIRRDSRKENRRDQDVCLLRDQFGQFLSWEIVGSMRELWTMLAYIGDGMEEQ